MSKYYLLLDTSTEVCTVALCDDEGTILGTREDNRGNKHAEVLALYADELLAGLPKGGKLSGVIVAEGPGSYTGLRIGAAYAKGLCWTLGIPLVTMTTPEVLAYTALQQYTDLPAAALLLPMIDARRMEVYTALYDHNGVPLSEIEALILTDENTQKRLVDTTEGRSVVYFGSGAEKAKEIFTSLLPDSRFLPDVVPHAEAIAIPGLMKLKAGETVDVAYWEPYYLKEYMARKSQNKVLERLTQK